MVYSEILIIRLRKNINQNDFVGYNSTSSKQDAQNNQNQDPNEASQNMNDKHLNSEETSLLNSSYADFHDVFKNLKKRQEQMKHKKHNDSIMFRGADLSTTLHDRSLDYLGGGQSILPHSVKNDSSIMHNYSAQGVSKMSQNSGTKNTQKNLLINRLAYKLLSQQKQRPLSLVNQNNPYNSLFGNPNNQHNNRQIQHNHSQIGKRHDLELSNIVKSCVQNVSSSRFLNKQNKLGQINNQIQHQGYDLKDPLMIGHNLNQSFNLFVNQFINLKGSLTQNSSFEHLNGNQQIRSNMPTSTFHRVEKTRKLSNQTDDLPHLNLKSRSQQQQLLQEQNENLDDNEDPKQTQQIHNEKLKALIRQDTRFRKIFSGQHYDPIIEGKNRRKLQSQITFNNNHNHENVQGINQQNQEDQELAQVQEGTGILGGMLEIYFYYYAVIVQHQESDDSMKKLAYNDSLRYEGYTELMKDFKNISSKSVFLLNSKYKYRQYIQQIVLYLNPPIY